MVEMVEPWTEGRVLVTVEDLSTGCFPGDLGLAPPTGERGPATAELGRIVSAEEWELSLIDEVCCVTTVVGNSSAAFRYESRGICFGCHRGRGASADGSASILVSKRSFELLDV